jgi:uncharacterized membrane protein YtjA (UPF0391 family)
VRRRGAYALKRVKCTFAGKLRSSAEPRNPFAVATIERGFHVAALFGFSGICEASTDIARVLLCIFVVILLVLLILGLISFRSVSGP